ncbi:hypothetical protein WJX73_000596 [Symbiochloris irregularis]|uniref:Protein kinase domain-containing protein n=1 Tax=Symbiochloris irregularis TaxID=706552 RepID=A0AAW1PJX5_9CHLO
MAHRSPAQGQIEVVGEVPLGKGGFAEVWQVRMKDAPLKHAPDKLAFKEAVVTFPPRKQEDEELMLTALNDIAQEGHLLVAVLQATSEAKDGPSRCLQPLAFVFDRKLHDYLPCGLFKRAKYLHIDVKLQNVLITGQLSQLLGPSQAHLLPPIVLGDPGLGWHTIKQAPRRPEVFRGTAETAAPECFHADMLLDFPADVWSVCTCVEGLLPGGLQALQQPCLGNMLGEAKNVHSEEIPVRRGWCPPFTDLCNNIGGAFGDFLSRLLPLGFLPDPNERKSAIYLHQMLEEHKPSVLQAALALEAAGDEAAYFELPNPQQAEGQGGQAGRHSSAPASGSQQDKAATTTDQARHQHEAVDAAAGAPMSTGPAAQGQRKGKAAPWRGKRLQAREAEAQTGAGKDQQPSTSQIPKADAKVPTGQPTAGGTSAEASAHDQPPFQHQGVQQQQAEHLESSGAGQPEAGQPETSLPPQPVRQAAAQRGKKAQPPAAKPSQPAAARGMQTRAKAPTKNLPEPGPSIPDVSARTELNAPHRAELARIFEAQESNGWAPPGSYKWDLKNNKVLCLESDNSISWPKFMHDHCGLETGLPNLLKARSSKLHDARQGIMEHMITAASENPIPRPGVKIYGLWRLHGFINKSSKGVFNLQTFFDVPSIKSDPDRSQAVRENHEVQVVAAHT